MRRRITKSRTRRCGVDEKDVVLRVNKAGLLASGKQRYCVVLRFTENAQKKASNNEYVAIELDDDQNRLYFITSTASDGFKMTHAGQNSRFRCISITVDDVDEWRSLIGDYDMKKDVNENAYYIDLPNCPKA